eukprot:m.60815 g.60815  ORF g.60815 m.60815 type:complete len:229 (+) comp11838_c0_seq3:930-1616(+)
MILSCNAICLALSFHDGSLISHTLASYLAPFMAGKHLFEQFLAKASSVTPQWKDGCTATTLLTINGIVYAANVGDTKAVVGRWKEDKFTCLPLTKDHTATQYEERMRIEKAGGTVTNGRIQGIMEISRSIGDGRFKSLGVTAQPNIARCTLTAQDKFLLIACDGLWDCMTPLEAAQFVGNELKTAKVDATLKDDDGAISQFVANKLVNEAVHRGSQDNVSVVLVLLAW